MIKNVVFHKKRLTISYDRGHKEIDIEATIYDVVYIDGHIVVLLSWEEFENSELYNRNIICLNEEGARLWRVEDPDWHRSGKVRTNHPFTGMRRVDIRLIGYTSDGFDIPIDIETGKLGKDWEFTK